MVFFSSCTCLSFFSIFSSIFFFSSCWSFIRICRLIFYLFCCLSFAYILSSILLLSSLCYFIFNSNSFLFSCSCFSFISFSYIRFYRAWFISSSLVLYYLYWFLWWFLHNFYNLSSLSYSLIISSTIAFDLKVFWRGRRSFFTYLSVLIIIMIAYFSISTVKFSWF